MASNYSWTKEYIISNTYFQLKQLGLQIAEREYKQTELQFHTIRMAQHGDELGCEQFLDEIRPESYADSSESRDNVGIPFGIVHVNETTSTVIHF